MDYDTVLVLVFIVKEDIVVNLVLSCETVAYLGEGEQGTCRGFQVERAQNWGQMALMMEYGVFLVVYH